MPPVGGQHSHPHLPGSSCVSLAAISARPGACLTGFSNVLGPNKIPDRYPLTRLLLWLPNLISWPLYPSSPLGPESWNCCWFLFLSQHTSSASAIRVNLTFKIHPESSLPHSVATIVVKATSVSLLSCCNNLLIMSSWFHSHPYAIFSKSSQGNPCNLVVLYCVLLCIQTCKQSGHPWNDPFNFVSTIMTSFLFRQCTDHTPAFVPAVLSV